MSEPTDSSDYVSVVEAAARLGVSERTIYRRIKKGVIKAISEGDRTFVDMTTARQKTGKRLTLTEVDRQWSDKIRIAELEAEAEGLRKLVVTLEANNERWAAQAAGLTAVITELKLIEAKVDYPPRWQFWRKQ